MATHGAMPAVIGRADDSALKLAELSVEGMTCAACSGAVERALKQMNGVEQAEFLCGRGAMGGQWLTDQRKGRHLPQPETIFSVSQVTSIKCSFMIKGCIIHTLIII